MAEVVWTEQAKNDLHEIYNFFLRDSEDYAGALVDRLYWSTERLNDFPLSGRNIPELQLSRLREIIVENYRILYEFQEQTVNILAVIHSRQHLRIALKKRISRR